MSRGRIMRVTDPILVLNAGASWSSPEIGDEFAPKSGFMAAFLNLVKGNTEVVRITLQGSMNGGTTFTNLSGPDEAAGKDPFTGDNIDGTLQQWVTLNGAPNGSGWSPIVAPLMRFRASIQSGATGVPSVVQVWVCEARFD